MGLAVVAGFTGFLIGAMLMFIVNILIGLAALEKQKQGVK